jgi:hypothetical protein
LKPYKYPVKNQWEKREKEEKRKKGKENLDKKTKCEGIKEHKDFLSFDCGKAKLCWRKT